MWVTHTIGREKGIALPIVPVMSGDTHIKNKDYNLCFTGFWQYPFILLKENCGATKAKRKEATHGNCHPFK